MQKLTPEEKAKRKLESDRKAYQKRRFIEQKRAEQFGFTSWADMIAHIYDDKAIVTKRENHDR